MTRLAWLMKIIQVLNGKSQQKIIYRLSLHPLTRALASPQVPMLRRPLFFFCTTMASPEESNTSPSESFRIKLETRVESSNSLLCIGLDPHPNDLFPSGGYDSASEEARADAAFTFCKTLIDATLPCAACYKPNAAFFEALGAKLGAATLQRVVNDIPNDVPVLLDVKRGDIGSTAEAYATASYDHAGADAVTLSPLMGWDSVKPFVSGK